MTWQNIRVREVHMEFNVRLSKKHIMTIVAVVVIIVATLFVFYNVNGHSLDPSDRDFRVVVTGSMDGDPQPYEIPTIPVNSLITIKHLSSDGIKTVKVGDVLAFNWKESGATEARLTVHRVTEIHTDTEGNVTGFTTVGDIYVDRPGHFETPDVSDVVGIVIEVSPNIGKVVHFIQTSPIYVVMIIAVIAVVVSVVRDVLRARWTEDEIQ